MSAATVSSYTHPPLRESAQEPDTKEGDYYVTVGDDGRDARYGLLLGPFRNDHATALARVAEARGYVEERYPRATWWAFGTCRLDVADDNPVGKLNETLTERNEMQSYEIQHVYTDEVLSTVEAESPLAALDAYAVAQGFVPYSELPDEDGTEWTFTLPDGRLAGIFTNYSIAARPTEAS